MSDPHVAYFFRKFYRNIIKWWFVVYNPIARRIWPSKAEEEAAIEEERRLKEEEEARLAEEQRLKEEEEARLAEEQRLRQEEEARLAEEQRLREEEAKKNIVIDDETYNATTGSYSGLYGKAPVDDSTQAAFDEIMNKNKSNNDFASLASAVTPTGGPSKEEQDAILSEANAIYERLLREAAEDEAKKQAEIEAIKAAQQ